ncbi:iron-containing alcohol dehydrogenase [bacterium]|nr:iron-containing alcohol dehydrogenase [candidate division CSSED10-310 bacterium]
MKTSFGISQIPPMRFGYQVIRDLTPCIQAIGASRVLLIIDKEMRASGLTRPVEEQIMADFPDSEVHVIQESILSFRSIRQVLEATDPERFNTIAGYGGWRCTDMCKVLSIAATNPITAEMVKTGQHLITAHGVPILSIPTTPPNGAEIDDSVMIRDEETGKIHMFTHPFMIPRMTLIDPGLMITIPPDLTASTGLDALSHAIDALISIDASPFSEMYALQGFALLRENIITAFRQPDNIKARYNVALGSLYSALALNMTGSGAVHAMAYPLTSRCSLSHPQASALMLPHVMKYNLPVVPMQFVRMARYLGKPVNGNESDAQLAVEAIIELYQQLDQPIDLRAFRVPRIELDNLVQDALEHESFLARNPRILDNESLRAIYEAAM